MSRVEISKRRVFFFLAAIAIVSLLYNVLFISSESLQDRFTQGLGAPHSPETPLEPYLPKDEETNWDHPLPPLEEPDKTSNTPTEVKTDRHPIAKLMQEADQKWRIYEGERSQTFQQTVEKYRSRYGRHPPPGFAEWYKFARTRNVWNIDDFDQIMDDLRPFWAIEPKILRTQVAYMAANPDHGVSSIHIRNKTVVKVHNPGWRSDTMVKMIQTFIEHLGDIDIAMNRLDQPRVVVPWEDLQEHLSAEAEHRVMPPDAIDEFTLGQGGLADVGLSLEEISESDRYNAEWFFAAGKQYMDIAGKACPPESPARSGASTGEADVLYKESASGWVRNFNLSTDLCTVGPAIQNQHGMLYSASTIIASHKLLPIFGECKVNVNNDILFPANMYYLHDVRYDYDDTEDVPWRQKDSNIIWRGVTSGGVQIAENWSTMHRQRLVQLMNGTYMDRTGGEVNVLTRDMETDLAGSTNIAYKFYDHFKPEKFALDHTDIGFVEAWGCVPDCSFYDSVFSWKPQTKLTTQLRSKYLMDVDGHSFSGRWHAFLQSKSLGLKATIFREWHDSRLFAWRHFVPVDNRYDDLYSLLTYFVGYGSPNPEHASENGDLNPGVFIEPHDAVAEKLARQGREWALKVLRRDDIEIYMFRLMLEYARIMDDNRDRIGYSGDGSEMDEFEANGGQT